MERLPECQNVIQCTLAAKTLAMGHLVLYDITSSYMEGEYKGGKLVDFGYNCGGFVSRKKSMRNSAWADATSFMSTA